MLVAGLFGGLSLLSLAAADDRRLKNNKYPLLEIETGVLQGVVEKVPSGIAPVNKYLGIPFATTPPRRFTPPQRAPKEKGVRNATAFKPSCVQQFVLPGSDYIFNRPAPEESEDCLYLNVFSPSTSAAPTNGRPVLFWIYGGSLQFGNAGQPVYDGTKLAAYEDVVVVSANYRTNIFGFPSSPELNVTSRNLGFLDQRAALDWVQRNIAKFGGDPNKVTIFGESAGAFSIDALLTSYPAGSSPPFRGAILQSGQYSYNTNATADQTPQWQKLAEVLNCPRPRWKNSALACLQDAPLADIKAVVANHSLTFGPVIDGVTLVANPAKARRSGQIAKIPMLAGTNSQEGRVFLIGRSNVTGLISSLVGPGSVDKWLAAYNDTDQTREPYDVGSEIFTDYTFQCPQAAMIDDAVAGGIQTWRYYFNASFENTQIVGNLGAFHSSEIPLVFGTYSQNDTTVQQNALSQYMQSAWARFARNPSGGPGWNQVGTGASGEILAGASSLEVGGLYYNNASVLNKGSYNVAVLGDYKGYRGLATIAQQTEIDTRCGLYQDSYNAVRNRS